MQTVHPISLTATSSLRYRWSPALARYCALSRSRWRLRSRGSYLCATRWGRVASSANRGNPHGAGGNGFRDRDNPDFRDPPTRDQPSIRAWGGVRVLGTGQWPAGPACQRRRWEHAHLCRSGQLTHGSQPARARMRCGAWVWSIGLGAPGRMDCECGFDPTMAFVFSFSFKFQFCLFF
jgi:hypothetical protein